MIKILIKVIFAVVLSAVLTFALASCGCEADEEKERQPFEYGPGYSTDPDGPTTGGLLLPDDDLSDLNGDPSEFVSASDETSGVPEDTGKGGPSGADTGEPAGTGEPSGSEDPVGGADTGNGNENGSGSGSDTGDGKDPEVTLPVGSGGPIELPFDPFD